jgi:hypothetical protein
MQSKARFVWVLGAALLAAGCFDLESDSKRQANDPDPAPGGGAQANHAPTISGSPPPSILEGEDYEFTPTAADPDGDALRFTISRKPAWASFDPETGRLAGTPGAEHVGNFTNIQITVSDGKDSARLGAFDVSVNQIAEGQATLTWTPPTENADGSALTNLAGYRIYYGRNPNNLNNVAVVDNPGLTRYVIGNLTPAIWHFSMTAVTAQGVESSRTQTASKTVS